MARKTKKKKAEEVKQLFDKLWNQSNHTPGEALWAKKIYVKIENNIEKEVRLLNTQDLDDFLTVLENGPVLTNLKFDDLKSGFIKVKANESKVIDIVDSHVVFQRHYKKRKRFYNKQNFKILNDMVETKTNNNKSILKGICFIDPND